MKFILLKRLILLKNLEETLTLQKDVIILSLSQKTKVKKNVGKKKLFAKKIASRKASASSVDKIVIENKITLRL